jgi:hypothetical protein
MPHPDHLPTQIIDVHQRRQLAKAILDWMPQPGNLVELENTTYRVVERCHRYLFRKGKYTLYQMILYVQVLETHDDHIWIDGQWVIGDAQCKFNARSPLLRCAVNPLGPCTGCVHRAI